MAEPEQRRPWAEGIEPIDLAGLKLLGRDSDNNLYWNGKKVGTQLKLTGWQTLVAVVALLASVSTILNSCANTAAFWCARGHDLPLLGCPAPTKP